MNNFDERFDSKKLANDAKEIEKNGDSFEEVPFGTYEVHIEQVELKEAKSSGNPMMSIWFKVLTGEQKGRLIFYNQVLYSDKAKNPAFGIHMAKQFLRSLELPLDIEFESFEQFEQLLLDVAEEAEKFDYQLKYSENKSGYSVFDIEDKFNAMK